MSKLSLFQLQITVVLSTALLPQPARCLRCPLWPDSQARIVRLSDVQGSVQIDKNTGMGFENAFLNLPITQGRRCARVTAAAPKSSSRTAARCA
jgi:hypothetical protein